MARFGTVINCIDGRVQKPVALWMKDAYQLDFVDAVTERGPDKVLSESAIQIFAVRDKVRASIDTHHSNVVALAGHYDCAGNPVSKERHIEDIRKAVQVMRWWNLPVTIVGLWVNEYWAVEVVVH